MGANSCAISSFSTASCLSGKIPLYNEFRDWYLKPDIRKEAVIRGDMPALQALLIDLRRMMSNDGMGYRTVKSRKYLSQEICSNNLQYNFTAAATTTITAATTFTLTISSPYSYNGTYSVPTAQAATSALAAIKHRATANVGGVMQTFIVTSVSTTPASALTVTLSTINGQTVTIANGTSIKFQYDPTIMYEKNCDLCIPTEGFQSAAPNTIQGNIQKFEKGLCICDDDIDNYAFDTIPDKMQVWDAMSGKMVDTWCLPAMKQKQLNDMMVYSELYNFLFGRYDAATDTGVNGILPTAQDRGNFNMPINTRDKASFLATLKSIAKAYTRQGIKSAVVFGDQEFMMNVDDMLAGIVGYNNFNLPVWAGSAQGMVDWYNFKGIKNIFGLGFDIQFIPLTGWEQLGYDSLMYNWGFVMPMSRYYDSAGNSVAPMEIVKLDRCDGTEFGQINKNGIGLWYDDTRERGCRKVNFYGRNSFGLDIHCAQNLGILTGGRKCSF